ncbi:hypothetical protein CC99x_008885 [Candidatus Berkiella cookevillensis]|uniref:Uncharacterized protein n=1 Tax=Candidatus Berkiella cookevillensis TaxID=437022 RepID=A0A0Q9YB22_9GAMM|nr:hypothetical protein [Candidatus Berkiella cookevillensis]MCS5709016.1 hypothetical protein [Candidatus Berkiella cookevillensis]
MKIDIRKEVTFRYLLQIKKFLRSNPITISSNKPCYQSLINILFEISSMNDSFESNIKYEKQYTKLHEAMEKVAKYELKKENREYTCELDALFIQFFENDSHAHDFIAKQLLGITATHNKEKIKAKLAENTTNPNKKTHVKHPDNPANAFFSSMLGYKYHPLKRNNVPYVAFDETQLQQNAKCLRIGAQTQKSSTVNPAFERYLLANARRDSQKILNVDLAENEDFEYVYINLMKRDQKSQDSKKSGLSKKIDKFVRHSEGNRASALEALNQKEDLKTAVITLPADNEFLMQTFKMSKGSALNLDKNCSLSGLLAQIKQSIQDDRNDFYFSAKVKKILFGDKCNNGIIEKLFASAATDIVKDFDKNKMNATFVGDEERNALLFHFIKDKLTNHILNTLKPKAYNFTCKDAIDRGAIHTLWYHFNLFYEKGMPMSESEFLKYLDAPALIVKYRPLNHNRNLIWNALKHRVESDENFRKSHPWAIAWLNSNVPADQSPVSLKDDSLAFTMKKETGLDLKLQRNLLFALKKNQPFSFKGVKKSIAIGVQALHQQQQTVRCC